MEFYLFAVDIKNQELDYIDEILTNDSVPFILNCEQFERWINKNYRLVFYLLSLSKQNYDRIMDYLSFYYIEAYEYFNNEREEILQMHENYVTKPINKKQSIKKLKKSIFVKFFVEEHNLGQYLVYNENENYFFDSLKAYTYYILNDMNGLIEAIINSKENPIKISERNLNKLRNIYSKYFQNYNYNLYSPNFIKDNPVKFIPEGTKILTFKDFNMKVEYDLTNYIDVFNYIISNKDIKIDIFFYNFGNHGFELFIYFYTNFEFFDNSDLNNNLWYEFYKILESKNEHTAHLLLNFLSRS